LRHFQIARVHREARTPARLRTVLGTEDVLSGLGARFSGAAASGLSAFFTEQGMD
jgi:hypothetical protein